MEVNTEDFCPKAFVELTQTNRQALKTKQCTQKQILAVNDMSVQFVFFLHFFMFLSNNII